MTQSKKHSLIETITSTAAGFIVSLILVHTVLPLLGLYPSSSQGVLIVLIFTVASIIRGYIIRRIFNRWHTIEQ